MMYSRSYCDYCRRLLIAVKRFDVDAQEVEVFPSVGASAVEPLVSEEPVPQVDPPVSRVLDSPLVLLFTFFAT